MAPHTQTEKMVKNEGDGMKWERPPLWANAGAEANTAGASADHAGSREEGRVPDGVCGGGEAWEWREDHGTRDAEHLA